MKPHLRQGVTFFEVLSVVCIIAVMAAILFPIFQRVRESPHHGSCQSNLKQLGLAYIQYTQDSNEVFPSGMNAAGNGWAGKLYPFVKATGVYRCTSETAPSPAVSYAQNQNLTGQFLSTLAAPAATVELYEFTTPNCDPSTPETVSATGLAAPQNSSRHGSPAQPYGLNFAAVDGHVKYLGPAQVSSGPGALPTTATSGNGALLLTFSVK